MPPPLLPLLPLPVPPTKSSTNCGSPAPTRLLVVLNQAEWLLSVCDAPRLLPPLPNIGALSKDGMLKASELGAVSIPCGPGCALNGCRGAMKLPTGAWTAVGAGMPRWGRTWALGAGLLLGAGVDVAGGKEHRGALASTPLLAPIGSPAALKEGKLHSQTTDRGAGLWQSRKHK